MVLESHEKVLELKCVAVTAQCVACLVAAIADASDTATESYSVLLSKTHSISLFPTLLGRFLGLAY